MLKKQRFEICFRLPSRNSMENSSRISSGWSNSRKRSLEDQIALCVKSTRIDPIKQRCIVVCTFYEQDRRRDVDNVASGTKYILDSLKKTVLQNDSPRYVAAVQTFVKYSKPSRCQVLIVQGSDQELDALLMAAEEVLKG